MGPDARAFWLRKPGVGEIRSAPLQEPGPDDVLFVRFAPVSAQLVDLRPSAPWGAQCRREASVTGGFSCLTACAAKLCRGPHALLPTSVTRHPSTSSHLK